MATRGYASVEAAEAHTRARGICKEINDIDRLLGVLIRLRHVNQVQGRCDAGRDSGSQCLDIARRKGNRIFIVQANDLAHTLCIMGLRRRPGADCGGFSGVRSKRLSLTPRGIGPESADFLSRRRWLERMVSGLPRSSAASSARGRRHGSRPRVPAKRGPGDPYRRAHTHLLRREPEATQSYLDSALAILASTGFLQRIAQLRLMRGWALASQTDDRGALTELSEGLAGYRANGARARRTNFLALMVAWISACGQICRWPLHHCRGARSCDTARIPCSPSATTKTAGSGPCVHLFPDKPLDHFPSVPKALPAPVQKSQPVPAR